MSKFLKVEDSLLQIEKEYLFKKVEFDIDPSCTALIVVDMQNYFVNKNAYLWGSNPLKMLSKVKDFINTCRNLGIKIIYSAQVHHPNNLDRGLMSVFSGPNIIEGTKDAEIYPEFSPKAEDKIVYKHRPSAFYQTDLDLILRNLGIESIIICGTATNICCESTARDAFFRDYKVIFLSDLNFTDNKVVHENTLKTLRRCFALVIESKEALNILLSC
jgi:ureidoacrylate peracid hydrolase